jgi:hypothetical protein
MPVSDCAIASPCAGSVTGTARGRCWPERRFQAADADAAVDPAGDGDRLVGLAGRAA